MNDDCPTPRWLMQTFDGWDDPCPLGGGSTDGLKRVWGPRTYVNPPYSNPEPWADKAIEESRLGKQVVMLVRCDPSTKWWLKLAAAGARFAFFVGRIKFVGDGSPNFASALVFLPGA